MQQSLKKKKKIINISVFPYNNTINWKDASGGKVGEKERMLKVIYINFLLEKIQQKQNKNEKTNLKLSFPRI